MLDRFGSDLREVVLRTLEEARIHGSSSVEAEHLLLALATEAGGDARRVLGDAGLDHAAIEEALEEEFASSLMLVGVASGGLPAPTPRPQGERLSWGTSIKAVLRSASVTARAGGHRRMKTTHLLLAVLEPREGTVPRALRLANLDAQALITATQTALRER
jgi:ATP-dependent Clp protease ATP-binding subunit ClpA